MAGHLARTQQKLAAWGGNLSLIGTGIKAATAGARAMQHAEELQQKQLQQQQGGDSGDDAQAREALEQQAAMEMQETIDQSRLQEAIPRCQPSQTKEIRIRRAEGVRLLGKEFRLEMTPEDQAAMMAQAREQMKQMNMPTAAANTSDAGQDDGEHAKEY
jgi:hypothetical protein